jgi:DNA-binding transcriptional LysR family regulator
VQKNGTFPSEHQLELVAAVAGHGVITAATAALGISQPAVTAQLRVAELALGAALFERRRDGLRPTAAGKAVLAFVRRKEALTRGLLAELAEIVQGRVGTLIVGSSTTPAEYYLPAWLHAFRAAYPAIDVRLWIGNSRETPARLENGAVDVALVGFCPKVPERLCETVLVESIALFAAATSPYARRAVTPAALQKATVRDARADLHGDRRRRPALTASRARRFGNACAEHRNA